MTRSLKAYLIYGASLLGLYGAGGFGRWWHVNFDVGDGDSDSDGGGHGGAHRGIGSGGGFRGGK